MPQDSGSGQRIPPDLPGARNAYRQSVDPEEVEDGSQEAGATRQGASLSTPVGGGLNAPTPPPPYSRIDNSILRGPVERCFRPDGRVGVIASQGWIGGWSTRVGVLLDPSNLANASRTRRMQEIAMFDKEIITAILGGDTPRAKAIGLMKMGWPTKFCPDDMGLRVEWLAPGEEFEIMDGPGFERVRIKSHIDWWRA